MRLTVLGVAIAAAVGMSSVVAAQTPPAPPPPPPEYRGYVLSGGARIAYDECGSGTDVVLLIHDGVVHSAVFDDVWPMLCRRYHVVRFDRRGYGRSAASTTMYYEIDDVSAVLAQVHAAHATLVASSHGGAVAIDFTLAHPELVTRLVLVGAVVGGMPYSEHFLARGSAMSQALRAGDVAGGIKAISNDRYLIAPGNDAARKALSALLTASPQDVTHEDRILQPAVALPRLHEIRIPTLLLVGDADIPDVHAQAGAIEAGVPNARRIVVPGTGHLMYLEKPDEFVRLVTSFLDVK